MRRWAKIVSGILAMLASAAAAQDSVPRTYPDSGVFERADPDKSPELRAREAAVADADAAACDAGDAAGCGRLGRAHMYGEGRPQNRPVAELLLRKACNAADPNGCLWLGDLFFTLASRSAREDGFAAFRRSCRLGALEACEREAEVLGWGIWDEGGDKVAADALRRQTCAKGGAASCRTLASAQFGSETSEAERQGGKAELERLCRDGDRESCDILIYAADPPGRPPLPELPDLLDLGCRAGSAIHCARLARIVFENGSGPPESRSDALILLDRACDLSSYQCDQAAAIRARPVLASRCTAGSLTDCVALGELYAGGNSLISSPAEAVRLLGQACEAGVSTVCFRAAENLLSGVDEPARADAARADKWMTIACNAGDDSVCEMLGRRLLDGYQLPQDRARGFALVEGVCLRGNIYTCVWLDDLASESPDAPLRVADLRFSEPLTREEEEENRRKEIAESNARAEAERADSCTKTAVVYDGVLFEDEICTFYPGAIGGYRLQPGQAPWQALLWRPEKLGKLKLAPGQRVLCGGALIREGWVLTAAHCLTDQKAPIAGKDYRIRLGVYNPQADEGISFPILRTIAHPDYDPRSYAFDVALIQYDPRAGKEGAATNAITRILIDDLPIEKRTIRSGARVYSYGWGWTAAENSSSTDHLRGVRLLLTDRDTCTRITRYRGAKLDAALCAGGPNREQVCYGDSGGPLITYGDPGNRPTVIGVVSAGRKCGSTGEQSRFTRIGKVRDWIDAVLAGRTPARR